jgi:hypothetical protein
MTNRTFAPGLKIPRRKACRFESDSGHQQLSALQTGHVPHLFSTAFRICALLLCVSAAHAATVKAVWNGRSLMISDPPGSEHRLLCGYVHEKREVWRIFHVPLLVQTIGAVRCPSEITLAPGELAP